MGSRRPPGGWVAMVVYGAVLAGGSYWWLVAGGEAPGLIAFVGVLALLIGLDIVERGRWPAATPRVAAVGLLGARLALFATAATLDGSGTARALLILVPYLGYFAFGRAVSVALAAGCVGLAAAGYSLAKPGWYLDSAYVADIFMLGVGVVLAIAMAAVAAREQDARARLELSLERVAELSAATERNRVARDIHDAVGHDLTVIAIQLEQAAAFAQRDPELAGRSVAAAQASARQALAEVRRSVRALREDGDSFSLRAALAELTRRSEDGTLKVRLDVQGDPGRLDAGTRRGLYRAAQEGLTNVRRHAAAQVASVSLSVDDATARLTIADDGTGFDPQGPVTGFGLRGLRERAQLLGGGLTVQSGPSGTVLTVTVPGAGVAA